MKQYTMERINKVKSWFFERTNRIHEPLIRLTERKREAHNSHFNLWSKCYLWLFLPPWPTEYFSMCLNYVVVSYFKTVIFKITSNLVSCESMILRDTALRSCSEILTVSRMCWKLIKIFLKSLIVCQTIKV